MENTDIKSKVKSLYDIMADEHIQELEINSADSSISIKRKAAQPILNKPKSPVQVQVQKEIVVEQTVQEPIEAEPPVQSQLSSENTIKSPITGIFYKAASPDSPAFAAEGDIVESGKVLCIIEAMKVMNEIKAQSKVKIIKILSENGKSVEAGQDLFEIEKL
ncbi:MAG: acetyl-CoA carboxylase, biotin carboxyl carrier protein [Elusimicrobiota bacterium]|jgi:acetyl-CoA carboxylase biotin carboxyl carrier protein|nr:acetyl-CoA carboxylase, biotin carboxyl carrier protein [Elusimicrobiota bacterium]